MPISLTVSPIFDDTGTVIGASKIARDISERLRLGLADEQRHVTEKLNEVGALVVSSLDRGTIVQQVTDVGDRADAAPVRRVLLQRHRPQSGESYMLYTLSGAPKEAFEEFPSRARPRYSRRPFTAMATSVSTTSQDPRFGKNPPYHGMPRGPSAGAQLSGHAGGDATGKSSADCSSATRRQASSPSSTSGWRRGSPPGPRSRSRTRGSMWPPAKRTD